MATVPPLLPDRAVKEEHNEKTVTQVAGLSVTKVAGCTPVPAISRGSAGSAGRSSIARLEFSPVTFGPASLGDRVYQRHSSLLPSIASETGVARKMRAPDACHGRTAIHPAATGPATV